MPRGLLPLLAFAASLLLAGCGDDTRSSKRIRLATTTSTRDAGLLEAILPAFEKRTGYDVLVIGVGTGQALALAERGEADLVLVHAREKEDAFVAAGHGIDRRDIMSNWFLVVGPRSDPAKINKSRDAGFAFRKIREAGARFVSRGDNSGTHTRELAIWDTVGGVQPWDGYVSIGRGMGAALTHADEKQAYLLVDSGTWLARRKHLDLRAHAVDDEMLRNPYGAILVNPARHPHVNAKGARALLDHLTSVEGRADIAAFRIDGRQLFTPVWPE